MENENSYKSKLIGYSYFYSLYIAIEYHGDKSILEPILVKSGHLIESRSNRTNASRARSYITYITSVALLVAIKFVEKIARKLVH